MCNPTPYDFDCDYAKHAMASAIGKAYFDAGGAIMQDLCKDYGAPEDWSPLVKVFRAPVEDINDDDIGDADDHSRDGQPRTPAVKLMRDLRKHFVNLQQAILEYLNRKSFGMDDLKSINQIILDGQQALTDVFRAGLPAILGAGMIAGASRIDASVSFDVSEPLVIARAEQISTVLSAKITESTAKGIGAILAKAIDAGLPISDIAEQIEDTYGFSTQRATTIARTESARAYTQGQEDAWVEEGVEGKKFLLAVNACPVCQAVAKKLGDKVIPVGQPFFKAGEQAGQFTLRTLNDNTPLVHPNCRCDAVPVF